MIEHQGSFVVSDDDGERYVIDILQKFIDFPHVRIAGLKSLKTRDGRHVNLKSKGEYELAAVGFPLHSTDPRCVCAANRPLAPADPLHDNGTIPTTEARRMVLFRIVALRLILPAAEHARMRADRQGEGAVVGELRADGGARANQGGRREVTSKVRKRGSSDGQSHQALQG